jgi:hypothetical protein
MPFGITLFLIFLVLLECYYFFFDYLTSGLFAFHGYTLDSLSTVSYMLITLFLFFLVIVALYVIVRGFIFRKDYIRKFTIAFIIWVMLWALWGILIGNNVGAHSVLVIIYILMIVFLMTEYVKEYFREALYFTYGPYTLYTRRVELLSGKTLDIYFFSIKTPKSGTPTVIPEGYEVGVNERNGLPYLKKKGKFRPKEVEVYKHGKYTLYTRTVDLESGRTLDIYFFSSHKPKSGRQCPLPEGYEVGINKRNGLPYLRKKGRKPKVAEQKQKEKAEEPAHRKPSNVIYVVNRPQPGQVKGDWAVRSHGKIFSSHRTQENAINAIKAARKIAKDKDATVMIQGTDGKFRESLKPKK